MCFQPHMFQKFPVFFSHSFLSLFSSVCNWSSISYLSFCRLCMFHLMFSFGISWEHVNKLSSTYGFFTAETMSFSLLYLEGLSKVYFQTLTIIPNKWYGFKILDCNPCHEEICSTGLGSFFLKGLWNLVSKIKLSFSCCFCMVILFCLHRLQFKLQFHGDWQNCPQCTIMAVSFTSTIRQFLNRHFWVVLYSGVSQPTSKMFELWS